jgi:hypothetical protein
MYRCTPAARKRGETPIHNGVNLTTKNLMCAERQKSME